MSWIQTRSGKAVDLLAPRAESIDFCDIAHALARICRFVGHCRTHYSVAEHSVRVARIMPPGLAIHGLLHDAHEAYLGDWSSPLKTALPPAMRDDLRQMEDGIRFAIYQRAGIPLPSSHVEGVVKWADVTMLMTERRDLLGEPPRPWGGELESVEPCPAAVKPWTVASAELAFIDSLGNCGIATS